MVYPVKLEAYKFPSEIGSFIFMNNHKRYLKDCPTLVLDCNELGISSSMDLLQLCTYRDAAEYVIYKGLFTDEGDR